MSLREGFFCRRSNPTTIASSERFRIASFLAMTTLLLKSTYGNGVSRTLESTEGVITLNLFQGLINNVSKKDADPDVIESGQQDTPLNENRLY